MNRIQVVTGDITSLDVDAIVNAANSSLLGGGGVDGAIHRAAGPALREFCSSLGGCATGEAKVSPGFKLKARLIIHTVGPVWRGGQKQEAELLASCYLQSLRLAEAEGCHSLAFPAISTGAYGYPAEEAARIAVQTVSHWLSEHALPEQVLFVCFHEDKAQIYQQLLADLQNGSAS